MATLSLSPPSGSGALPEAVNDEADQRAVKVYDRWRQGSFLLDTMLLSHTDGPPTTRVRGGLRASFHVSRVATVASAMLSAGHLAFGHPATGIGFVLLTAVGTMTTMFLHSVRKARQT